MAEREVFDAEAEERRWWEEWWAEDYSWEGLGKLDEYGSPEKSWHGWVVVDSETGQICLPLSSLTSKRHVLRSASLQDYWRADPTRNWLIRSDDELIEAGELSPEFEPSRLWHIAHMPIKLLGGSKFGWKNDLFDNNWIDLNEIIQRRINVTQETEFTDLGILSGVDFRAQFNGIVVIGSKIISNITGKVNHVSAKFSYHVNDTDFSFGKFGDGLDFSRSFFSCGALFSYTKFLGSCRFNSSTVSHGLGIIRGQFLGDAYMSEMKVGGAASFKYSRFSSSSKFSNSYFVSGLYLDKIFSSEEFELRNIIVGNKFTLEGAQFKGAVDLRNLRIDSPESCWRSAFDSAHFEGFLDFRGCPYRLIAMFDGARIEGGVSYPKQGESSALRIFDQEVIAPIYRLPDRRERDEAFKAVEHGAQVLKHQMRLQADSLREQRFYRFELIARRLQSTTHWSERWSSRAFAFLGDYGLSVARPLAALACVALIFGLAYFLAAASITHMSLDTMTVQWGAPIHPAIAHPLELALTNMLGPLRYWGSGYQPYGGEGGAGFRLVIGTLGLIQQLLSLILIFLTALALRRRFQIG